MQSRALSLTALMTLSAATAACAVPVSTDQDPVAAGSERIQGGTAADAYPEAILLDVTRGGQTQTGCTGALVGPRAVLTSGRCATQFDGWTARTTFSAGDWARGVGSAVYDYDQTADAPSTSEHDIGLVFLDASIPLGSYPTLATAPLADGAEVVSVGRVLDGEASGSTVYLSAPVAVHSAAGDGYLYDYATSGVIEHGDSGGPDFLPGTHTLVAVNAGSANGTELLARVDLVNAWIQDQLATAVEGGGYPGDPGWPDGPGDGHGNGHGGGGQPGDGHGGGGQPGDGHGGGGQRGGGHGGGGQGGGGQPGDGHGGGGQGGGGQPGDGHGGGHGGGGQPGNGHH